MKRMTVISIAVLSLLLGMTVRAYAQHEQQGDTPKQEQRGDKKNDKSGKPNKPQVAPEPKPGQQPQTRPGQLQQQQQQPDRSTQPQRERAQQQPDQTKRQQQRAQQEQQVDRNTSQQRVQQPRPTDQNRPRTAPAAARLSPQRQQQLVTQQEQRLAQYRQQVDQQQRLVQQQGVQLQRQKRMAQFRVQQDYLAHLRQQQVFLNDYRPDYDHDPFFFSAFTYRYNRGGRFYETNQYGADRLREAVNNGYNEGLRAGAADREDHWRFSYEDSYAYQDANYGYNGDYVDRDDYTYYFREGFRRGYDDGYYSRSQYGRNDNGVYVMLDINLSQLLGLQPIH